jgi:hypothetical protein
MTVTSMLSPLSLTQFFYESGELVRTARLFFYHPSTLDPITVYQDAGLGVPHDSPIATGGKGRCPPVYVGTEPYRVRVFDVFGSLIEEIPLLEGATAAAPPGGGSVLTPAEKLQLLQTGDMVTTFANGAPRAGFVRANGMLLAAPGFAGVGYNIERQSADVEFLFKWLWGQSVDAILPVIGGRGANSTDDWAANKAITLPDLRGRAMRGIDSVGGPTGSTEANRLAGVGYALGTDNLVGSLLGQAGIALSIAQMPAHTHGVTGSPTGITTGAAAVGITVGGAYADIGAAYTGLYLVQASANITVHANYTGITFTDPGHDHSISASVPQIAGSGGVVGSAFQSFSGAYTDVRSTGAYITDPSHTHPVTDGGHNHVMVDPTHAHPQNPHAHVISDPTHAHVINDPWHTHTTVSVGSGAPFETIGPTMLVSVYIKL